MAGPGPIDTWDQDYNIDDGTSCRMPSRLPGPFGVGSPLISSTPNHTVRYLPGEAVSVELADAPPMCVPTTLSEISLAEMKVLAWLLVNRSKIVEAEKRFHVDRRAIAGAIAWEALMNVRGGIENTFGHFVGPGKSHVWKGLGSQDTLVKQVEDASWLPKREQISKESYSKRKKLLATPVGAITYIAASMNAAAHLAEEAGFPPIRKRPEVLANFWQSSDLNTWKAHLEKKPRGSDFHTGNDPEQDMDIWVLQNIRLLEDGVGKPEF